MISRKIPHGDVREAFAYIEWLTGATNYKGIDACDKLSELLTRKCTIEASHPKFPMKSYLEVDKLLSSQPSDFARATSILNALRKQEYSLFLKGFRVLHKASNAERYYRVFKSILCPKITSATVTEISDPSDGDNVITDPQRVRMIIGDHYRSHFQSNQYHPLRKVGEIKLKDASELTEPVRYYLSWDKAPSFDCVPDVLVHHCMRAQPLFFVDYVNEILRKRFIPAIHCTARLHILNKCLDETATVDTLRLLMPSSPSIKLLEIIALSHLKKLCQGTAAHSQIGFLRSDECQAHLVRVLTKIREIRQRPNNQHQTLPDAD